MSEDATMFFLYSYFLTPEVTYKIHKSSCQFLKITKCPAPLSYVTPTVCALNIWDTLLVSTVCLASSDICTCTGANSLH